MKQVQQYFRDYPAKAKCFTTSDGLVFHERGDANMHATSLKDTEVDEHTSGKNADNDNADLSDDANGLNEAKSAETKTTVSKKNAAPKKAAEKKKVETKKVVVDPKATKVVDATESIQPVE